MAKKTGRGKRRAVRAGDTLTALHGQLRAIGSYLGSVKQRKDVLVPEDDPDDPRPVDGNLNVRACLSLSIAEIAAEVDGIAAGLAELIGAAPPALLSKKR